MNVKNRTLFTGDNLPILRGMESDSVDLIYLDPPFNSNRHYSAPIGSQAAGAAFKDAWTFEDTDAAWWGQLSEQYPALYSVIHAAGEVGGKGDQAYLIYMAIRLLELQRVLKLTGSLYLHCDPTMSHSLKLALDAVFGKKNFRNEIVWGYRTGGISKKYWPKKHDILLVYGKEKSKTLHHPIQERVIYEKPFFNEQKDEEGRFYADVYVRDVWDEDKIKPIINVSKERLGYPTQKPEALLQRIIQASSQAGDMVLDPFCGCATTLVAAEKLGRQWIGVDISPRAIDLVKIRMSEKAGIGDAIKAGEKNHLLGLFGKVIHRTDIPVRDAPKPSPDIKHRLYGLQEGKCNGCRTHFPFQNMTKDHVVPKSLGGADTNDNLQLLCNFCNSLKGDRTMEYLHAELKRRELSQTDN